MILDKNTLVSDDQTLAFAAGAALSTSSYDFGATGTDALGNTPIADPGRADTEFLITITESVTSAGAATVQFELVMADDAALTSNLTVLRDSGAIAKATLVAGYKLRIGGDIPPGTTKRYLGMRYTVAVATTTAGKVTAGVVLDRDSVSV